MNPNVDNSPGMPLPEPLPVSQESGAERAPSMEAGSETAAPAPMEAPRAPQAPQFTLPVDDSQAAASDNGVAPVAQPAGPPVADDGDVIEKEWIVKAKQIVNSTRQDPYQQNRQLAAFKADYLQKRYNKIVKLSE